MMTGASSTDEPVAESAPVESTGCAFTLDHAAAGCAPLESQEDHGTADHPLQASDASTGCAAAATADATPGKPQPPQTLRAFEHALRELGFSQRQAAAIARSGFKANTDDAPQPEPEPKADPFTELRDLLRRRVAELKDQS